MPLTALPLEAVHIPPGDIERFNSKVQRDADGCWLWTGCMGRDGYGQFTITREGHTIHLRAHRFSFALANGRVGSNTVVCHTCDTPACVKPAHLFEGTPYDNSRDMAAKGRSSRKPSGGIKGKPILSERQREECRAMRAQGMRVGVIAAHFGVGHWLISKAIAGCGFEINRRKGSENRFARLDESAVRAIREEAESSVSWSELARRYGVKRSTIDAIITRRTWKHVD